MKIIWSLPVFEKPQTGGEKAFTRLAELLESKGIQLIKTYRDNKERKGIIRQIIINFRNLATLIRQDKRAPIFQNIFNRHEFLLANLVLSILYRRKIITFIHEVHEVNHLPSVKKRYLSFVNSLSFRTSSLIVVNSRYTSNWVCGFGDFGHKIFLMYPVVKSMAGRSENRKEMQKGPIRILCVGNIRRNKGQIFLLQAMKDIDSNYTITFAGLVKEEVYMDLLQEYTRMNGMSDNVRFKGFLNERELSEEYEKADIFVSPTLKEGFGLAVLEAMSYGLPVIASDVGAISELIDKEVSGLLVEPGNPASLSRAIREVVDAPDFAAKLRKNAKGRAAEFKTIEEQMDTLYDYIARKAT